MTKNSTFLRAITKQSVSYTPVWIMRQAGRYLPEYRALRSRVQDFLTLCKTPELACEVTLQPLQRFPLDAAIIFSDILTIPDAMGLGLYFETNEGPKFSHPVRDAKSIKQLGIPDMGSDLRYVMDAIRLTKNELAGHVPLIGFTGSPWTLATYMVEGGSSKNFQRVKQFLFTEPNAFEILISKLISTISLYLIAQANAGADALMIFDTWGGVLSTEDYQQYSLQPMSQIISNVKKEYPSLPIILFTKNGGQWLSEMANSGADALGLDWTIDIGLAKKTVGNKVALQGNMDPAMLYATPERIRLEVGKILKAFGTGSGHIFNLGHGIYPDVPPENVRFFIECVHELSKPYHSS